MSNELATKQEVPAWMKTSAAPQLGLTVSKPQKVVLIQDKRPKDIVIPKGTETGDLVLDPSSVNIGKTLQCVILATHAFWLRIGNAEKFGDPVSAHEKLMWKADVGNLTPEQAKDTVWQKNPTTGKNFRKAEYRLEFLVIEASGDASKPVMDPNKYGPLVIAAKGMSIQPVEKFIQAVNAKESQGYKSLGLVVKFFSKTVSDNEVQAYHPEIVGVVSVKETFDMLVETAAKLRDHWTGDAAAVAAGPAGAVVDNDPPF